MSRGRPRKYFNIPHGMTTVEYVNAQKRQFINSLKSLPCTDCGNAYPPCVMDFDHRDPSTKLVKSIQNLGIEDIKLEVLKCDLVCSNCHRIRTWMKGNRARVGRPRKGCSKPIRDCDVRKQGSLFD